ncbi:hypothetical protein C8258_03365 [Nocardia sp. MDA0666]|uniref:DUF5995 family protein n=1 Tax=Nocardia sp. MDA0666 TaxID=2135448 RepID=UPI000D13888E|nr:DUF5995 family protein [Nocardia sp. MDA0666]PSR70090.1 hypothetical protein C8258_03365 [Nocardia sp. MDA0666]
MLRAASIVVALAFSTLIAAAPQAGAVADTRCGTPLSPAEIRTVAELSDTTTIGAGSTLDRFDEAVARNHRITEILTSHHDRRGLFDVGLDAVEQDPVLPLQHDPSAFVDPEYAHAISYELLRRFLVNLHAEFTDGTPEPHWAWYFQLAGQCDQSPARVAMAGYNAHLTVDLAYAVAAVGSRPENAPDFFHIVDAIARSGDLIVDRTKQVYNADLGPLWRFYFVGEGLDRLFGQGVATGPLLQVADLGYNVVVWTNGLALQNPATAEATRAEINALWSADDAAFAVLARLGGL